MLQYSGWGEWVVNPFACILHSHNLGKLTHTLPLPPKEKSWLRISLLALSWAALRKHDAGKVTLFLLPTSLLPNLCVCSFFSSGVLELLFWKHWLPKGSEWLFKTVLSRSSQTTVGKEWNWFTGHFRVHSWTKICLLITEHIGGKNSQVPWHMVLDPKAPTKALCPWMDAKFWLLVVGGRRGGGGQETFYAATMLYFILF